MTLPIDYNSDDYKFNKTLHYDVELLPSKYGNKWDLQFTGQDFHILTGKDSLRNAINIAIMTRLNELDNELYKDFGCQIHELIKQNKSITVQKKISYYIENTLNKMRRIKSVNEILVIDNKDNNPFKYGVFFNITSITDEIITGSVNI